MIPLAQTMALEADFDSPVRKVIDRMNRRLENIETEVKLRLSTCEATNSRDDNARIEVPIKEVGSENIGSSHAGVDSPGSRSKSFCDFVTEMASQSSLHGLPVITTTGQTWIKLFWMLLMLAGFGMAIWQMTEIFAEYFRAPVVTKVETLSGGVDLPQVTVCNRNPFLFGKIWKDPNYIAFFESKENENYTFEDWINSLSIDDRIKLSHNITDFITWRDDLERASELTYSLVPTSFFGNCFTFVQNAHPKNTPDIKLFINLNSKEYPYRWEMEGFAFLREKGLYASPDDLPEPFLELQPGYKYIVRLQMETIVRLNGRYGQCSDIEKGFYEDTGMFYSQDACTLICPMLQVFTKCGCIPIYEFEFRSYNISKQIDRAPNCTGDSLQCYSNLRNSCECRVRCVMKKYIVTKIDKFKLGTTGFCYHWQECMDKDNHTQRRNWVKNNAVELLIKFPSKENKIFRQTPEYPLFRFLPDIGGTLGLYLGVSLLTLAEIPQLLIGTVIFLVKKNIRRRKGMCQH